MQHLVASGIHPPGQFLQCGQTFPPPPSPGTSISPTYLSFILSSLLFPITASLGFSFLSPSHFSLSVSFLKSPPNSPSLSSGHTIPVSAVGFGMKALSCFPLRHSSWALSCHGPSTHSARQFVHVILLLLHHTLIGPAPLDMIRWLAYHLSQRRLCLHRSLDTGNGPLPVRAGGFPPHILILGAFLSLSETPP